MKTEFYQEYFAAEKGHWWFRVRRNLINELLSKYLPGRPTEAKVLDYGCGSGYLVGELQRAGYLAYGEDTSRQAIEFGREQGIKNLSVSQGDAIASADNSFAVVLALDVIEHIADDKFALREIERVLKPNGVAIITAPAYMFLWGKQDEVSQHFRRYRLGQLVNLICQNTDLKIVRQSYFNTLLFPAVVLFRLLDRVFKVKRQSDFELNSSFLNQLLYGIFNLEVGWLKHSRFPFGVSILLVLKKHD